MNCFTMIGDDITGQVKSLDGIHVNVCSGSPGS